MVCVVVCVVVVSQGEAHTTGQVVDGNVAVDVAEVLAEVVVVAVAAMGHGAGRAGGTVAVAVAALGRAREGRLAGHGAPGAGARECSQVSRALGLLAAVSELAGF